MKKNRLWLHLFFLFPLFSYSQHWVNEPNGLVSETENNSLVYPRIEIDTCLKSKNSYSIWRRKLFDESLIEIDSTDFRLVINPIVDFNVGIEKAGNSRRNLYQNTRGYNIYGRLGKNFFFNTEYYENQARPILSLKEYVDTLQSLPRLIRSKTFKSDGIDYAPVFGKMSWKANEALQLTVGYDKIHIGNGYRSMILSSDSKPYPFLMSYYKREKWAIGNINAVFYNSDLYYPSDTLMLIPKGISGEYQRKWMSLNWIEWFPRPFIHLGITDIIVCRPESGNGNHGYISQLSLLPGLRPFIYSQTNNLSLLAAWMQIEPLQNLTIYSQFITNQSGAISKNTQRNIGYQAGISYFKRFTRWDYSLRIEYNRAQNYTYAMTTSNGSYIHLGQSLAHPLGQNFQELLIQGKISYKKWKGTLSVHQITFRDYDDIGTYYGNYDYLFSIFSTPQSPDQPVILIAPQFTDRNIQVAIGEIAYSINKKSSLEVFGRMIFRKAPTGSFAEGTSLSTFVGLRHLLRRSNPDFF